MQRVPRLVALLGLAGLTALGCGGNAFAGEQTLTFFSKPISVEGYGVVQKTELVESPKVDGYVVGMSADVVDSGGSVQGDEEIMLHHIVVAKIGTPDLTCTGLLAERFYAEGEERTKMALPEGYGYPNRASDGWGMLYMLMNHRSNRLTGRVRYTVRYVTDRPLKPVKPVWLDVRNCGSSEFDVPGTGKKGSTFTKTWDYTIPQGGALIAGGGHLHGGGIRLELRNAACQATPFTSLPSWGEPEPKPILHEAGPRKMSSFTSAAGIPVSAGDRLQLAAVYDNSRPHVRAMGIMLLYLAPDPGAGCRPTPSLALELGQPSLPPPFTMPLPRPPRGPLYRNLGGTWVGDYRYGHERLSIRARTTFAWRFVGQKTHDVTLASGPVGFSSPALRRGTFRYRFTRPGMYRLYCSLHPTRMTQIITARRH